MFRERDPDADLERVRASHAPDAILLDCESDFETLSTPHLDELATLVDRVDPAAYPEVELPDDAPDVLRRIVGSDLVVGLPEHGSVTWTRRTTPPVALIRPRARGSPDDFVAFLIAEALVEIGTGLPESFVGFFGDRYADLTAPGLTPGETYQVAAALYDAYLGLHARPVFAGWEGGPTRLHGAWIDAGERLEPRLSELPARVRRGETGLADATELACSAVKHDLEVPPPFGALDTAAYRDHGADFAVRWARRVLDSDDA